MKTIKKIYEKIIKNINESLINLKNSINRNEILENENLKKVVDILEKVLDFNKQEKDKGRPSMLALCPSDLAHVEHIAYVAKVSDHSNFKILSPKQILQRLPKALAQVKAGHTSKKLLNKIREIIYSLYRAKEITKKYIAI